VRRQRFVAERERDWAELDALLARVGSLPDRLAAPDLLRAGALYRAAAADLALARRAFPGDPLTGRLERLVLRARQVVYAGEPRRARLGHFLATGYWRRVAERPRLLALSALLLFAPQVLAALWALDDPGAAIGVVPAQFAGAAEPGSGPGTLSAEEQAALSSEIFTNNIRVTFLAVAAGVTLGLGTAALLMFNGLFIGAIAGLAIGYGEAARLFELIVPHGVLELSCIVVSGAAGLRIGAALLDPGLRTRGEALRAQARPAVELVLGTIPWLVLAGLVEGYVTGSLPGLGAALTVGFALGVVYWLLVLWRGRQSRPRAFARR